MSVFKDGAVKLGSSSGQWDGTWSFTRNKKQKPCPFAYSFKGTTVPKSLLDYVSFLVDVPELVRPHKDVRGGGDRNKKKKGPKAAGRRGRVAATIHSPAAATATAAAAGGVVDSAAESGPAAAPAPAGEVSHVAAAMELKDGGGTGAGAGPSASASTTTTDADAGVAGAETLTAVGGAPNGAASMLVELKHTAAATASPGPGGGSDLTPSSPTDPLASASASGSGAATECFDADVELPSGGHPLLGLWSGHFELKTMNSHGKELSSQLVQEIFFFYGLAAGARPVSLDKLPEEPLPSAFMEMQVPKIFFPNSPRAMAAQQAVDVLVLGALPEPSPTKPVDACTAATRAPAPAPAHVPPPAATASPGAASSGRGLAKPGTPLSPEPALLSINASILEGYGRNQFGRFSLLGVYNEDTGVLKCEKRYMTCAKPSLQAKRNRKSLVVSTGLDPKEERSPLTSKRKRVNSAKARSMLEGIDEAPYERTSYSYSGSSRGGGAHGHGRGDGPVKRERQTQQVRDKAQSKERARELEEEEDERTATYKYASFLPEAQEVYEGGWAGGQRSGTGVCLYPDGSLFEGEWVRGREHGKGKLLTATRAVIYDGEWLDGLMHGKGVYKYASGDHYRGDFREGQRHGPGEYSFGNGCVYKGDWRENRRHGRGLFTWPDQSYYDGDWEDGLRHGRGLLVLSSGFSYDGSFCHNLMDGRGRTSFPGGQQYEGSFKNGLRDGRGSVTFAEGALYEGRFREDHMDGQGTLKVTKLVPGATDGELFMPVEIQTDLKRIHYKAGFGAGAHH